MTGKGDNMAEQYAGEQKNFSVMHFVVRLISGIVVLGITAWIAPGFRISSVWSLIVGAIVLAGLDYLVSRLLGVHATPFGRGLTGFIAAAVIIYVTRYIVAGYDVSVWGALIGALIYGVVDAIIPGKAM